MTMIMDVIKEENNNASTETTSYSTPSSINSVTLTSMSSVIHANQASVIQTVTPTVTHTHTHSTLPKNNVILVGGKLTSVIQAPNAIIHPLQAANSKNNMDDSLSMEEETKKRREKLIRRPSYRKILHDIRQAEFGCGKMESSGSDCDSNVDNEVSAPSIPVSAHYPTSAVVPGGHIQLSSHCGNVQGLPMMMSNSVTGSGSLIQYSNHDGSYYVPNDLVGSNPSGVGINNVISEDQVKKREIRLQKNREAARECRRKKKEYIKCLENRVAVLENQNKALIDELKSLKELYCQHKPDPQ